MQYIYLVIALLCLPLRHQQLISCFLNVLSWNQTCPLWPSNLTFRVAHVLIWLEVKWRHLQTLLLEGGTRFIECWQLSPKKSFSTIPCQCHSIILFMSTMCLWFSRVMFPVLGHLLYLKIQYLHGGPWQCRISWYFSQNWDWTLIKHTFFHVGELVITTYPTHLFLLIINNNNKKRGEREMAVE